MEGPLVSIIIPTFNRAHLIKETLDSIRFQTYTNWECIVVDDGSTDYTEVVLKEYIANDSRFQYHHRPESRLSGGNAARNYGFALSKGAYINWLDSDDLFRKDKLEIQVIDIVKNKVQAHICQGQIFETTEDSEKTFQNLWPEKFVRMESLADSLLLHNLRWPTGAALWSREAAGLNLWDEDLQAAQEWTFHIKQAFALQNPDFLFCEQVLLYVRKSETSITQNTDQTHRYNEYLRSRLKILEFLKADNIDLNHPYVKSIYQFSLRYIKYLVSVGSRENVDSFSKFILNDSFVKYIHFKMGLLIYDAFQKDYFLKTLL